MAEDIEVVVLVSGTEAVEGELGIVVARLVADIVAAEYVSDIEEQVADNRTGEIADTEANFAVQDAVAAVDCKGMVCSAEEWHIGAV